LDRAWRRLESASSIFTNFHIETVQQSVIPYFHPSSEPALLFSDNDLQIGSETAASEWL
jgi:hypothetical protein